MMQEQEKVIAEFFSEKAQEEGSIRASFSKKALEERKALEQALREQRPTPQEMWANAVDDAKTETARNRGKTNVWNMKVDESAGPIQKMINEERKIWFTKVS